MRLVENPPGAPPELVRVALVLHRKTPDADAVDTLDTWRPLVSPGHVIARARGDDLDLGMAREALGDVACMQLRAAVDVGAVALDDDRELHDSELSPPSPASPPPAGSRGGSEAASLRLPVYTGSAAAAPARPPGRPGDGLPPASR